MKKLILLTLCCVLVLGLCACGQSEAAASGGETQTRTSTTGAQETTGTAQETTGAAQETTEAAQDPKALAQSCETKSVDELYALIGQPQSSEYAPSCLHPGVGEDGMLYYEGFVVYTYKEGSTETVEYVE